MSGYGQNCFNTYFRAECKFTITNANPSGNGAGTLIMGLTAGTLDFSAYDASMSFATTVQDGICADINSSSPTDNNINDWQFFLTAKKGGVGTSVTGIYANSSIKTYCVRFVRIAVDTARLSVFTDSSFTLQLPGSPITEAIDSTIKGVEYCSTWYQHSGSDYAIDQCSGE